MSCYILIITIIYYFPKSTVSKVKVLFEKELLVVIFIYCNEIDTVIAQAMVGVLRCIMVIFECKKELILV